MKEMIPLSLRQRKAFVWWARREYEDYAAIICDGAIRSGKTLAMGMGFFFWAMACFSDRQFALCGRSVGALRRNLLETVLPQLRRLGFACEEKRSEKLLIVRRRGRENRFYLFGGANEASAALIQGMTLAGVLFDEAALMPRSFVEQASARCSVEGSRLWFSCNPEGPNHWFYREWVCRAEEKRALYLHFTMADNPSLSARVRARYESMYSGIFYRRFVLGEWTAAEGRIYDFYAPGEYAQEAPAEPWERLRVSVDYGTVNPTSMGLWALKDGVWYRVDEYYYDSRTEGRQKTDEEYVDALEELTRGRRIERVIVDPSAASFIETLRRRGFRVMRANNAVADGLLVIRRLRLACLITFERPEAGAVRRQDLVAKDDLAILIEAELELRVGDDDAARKSIRSALLVDGNRIVAQFLGILHAMARELLLEDSSALLEGDILVVVAELCLRARREDRLRQLLGFLEASRQLDAADRAVLLIACPAAARDIAADNALHRQHRELLALHAVAEELRLLEELRHVVIVHRDHVVRNDVLREVEPELRHLRQDFALLRDLVLEDVVECGDAVCRNHDDAVACIVNLTNFSGFERLILFHVLSSPVT